MTIAGDLARETVTTTEVLLQAIKDGVDEITLAEAHEIHSKITEAKGYLESCRTLLVPPGVL